MGENEGVQRGKVPRALRDTLEGRGSPLSAKKGFLWEGEKKDHWMEKRRERVGCRGKRERWGEVDATDFVLGGFDRAAAVPQ